METTITATHLARHLADILNGVRYRSGRFIVERNGEPIAVIEPAGPQPNISVRDALRKLAELPWPDDRFGEDVEEIQASQPPIPPSPWPT